MKNDLKMEYKIVTFIIIGFLKYSYSAEMKLSINEYEDVFVKISNKNNVRTRFYSCMNGARSIKCTLYLYLYHTDWWYRDFATYTTTVVNGTEMKTSPTFQCIFLENFSGYLKHNAYRVECSRIQTDVCPLWSSCGINVFKIQWKYPNEYLNDSLYSSCVNYSRCVVYSYNLTTTRSTSTKTTTGGMFTSVGSPSEGLLQPNSTMAYISITVLNSTSSADGNDSSNTNVIIIALVVCIICVILVAAFLVYCLRKKLIFKQEEAKDGVVQYVNNAAVNENNCLTMNNMARSDSHVANTSSPAKVNYTGSYDQYTISIKSRSGDKNIEYSVTDTSNYTNFFKNECDKETQNLQTEIVDYENCNTNINIKMKKEYAKLGDHVRLAQHQHDYDVLISQNSQSTTQVDIPKSKNTYDLPEYTLSHDAQMAITETTTSPYTLAKIIKT